MIVLRPLHFLFSICVSGFAVLTPGLARAQGVDEFGPYGGLEKRNRESPQNFAVELRVGRYRPNVDQEFGGDGPYERTFGNKLRLSVGAEVDWQVLRIPRLGSIGPGVGWGYTSISGDAPFADTEGDTSAQETTLKIMPMYLVGVLRVDVLARETRIPLVPYVKAGFGYGLWWAVSANRVERFGDIDARGASYGYNFALGGMLLLNPFDRRSAVEMDAQTGINRAYAFIEWYKSSLDGFGAGDQMQIGTSTWVLGIAFEI